MKFLPSLTRLPKNKGFNFEPRYYDPIKEEIEQRKRLAAQRASGQQSGNEWQQASAIRERISMHYRRTARQDKRSTMMQLAIAGILILLFFAIFGW